MRRFQARSCTACDLRFPVEEGSPLGQVCPHCGAPTRLEDPPYETWGAPPTPSLPGPPVVALLDNLRSLSNVGSIFRVADGAGVSHLHLCGITPTPGHPRLAKTALGAEASVPWTHWPNGVAAAANLRERGLQLWALEGGEGQCLFELLPAPENRTLALVLGHEVSGVDPRILALCTRRVFLPMAGLKGSLNVAVAFAVAAYALRHGLRAGSRGSPSPSAP